MKHFNKLVILFMTLAFMAAAITGCKGSATPEDTTPKFTVTFDSDGGSAVAKKTVKEGEKVSEPAAPTKAGYEFEGWFIGDTAYDFSSEVTANITLKAKWYKAYTITFESNGGSNVDPIKVKEGTSAQAPKIPTRTGYSFLAWYLDGKAYDFSTTVTSDITLTAAWTIANYLVTFDADNGQTNETQIVKGFETASKPTTSPTKDGYTFIQWNYNGSPFDFNTPITSDITLTAEWIDNATIIGMTIDVTSENIVNTILTLTASRTLKATGNFDSTTISNINAALKTLYQTSPSILVRLDLSDTTGLTSIESIYGYEYFGSIIIEDKNKAFVECINLETIILPESVTSIGSYAFYNCTNLAKIVIPKSVTSIGNSAFLGCQSLAETYFNGTKEEFTAILSDNYSNPCRCNSALYLNGSKEDSSFIVIPDGKTSISYKEFENLTRIATITIPDSVTSIEDYAFSGSTGLTSITIPDSVTSIGDNAFYGCTGLTSITIPESVTSIGSSAFEGCTGLTSITIPASVTSIDSSAFRDCTGLTSITIPASVTSIGHWAFLDCTELKTVYYTGTLKQWLAINMGSTPFQNGADLYINNTKLEGNLTIPDSVTSIANSAFYGCTGLTSITIPDSVTSIANFAFYGCTGLTSITIPDSVTSIGFAAFEGCTGLTSITIPDSVTSIEGDTFYGCTGLTSITIPASVTSIGYDAFKGCTGLTSITIPDSVTSIEGYTFYGCIGLTSITIPNSVTSIGDNAFSDCTGLKSITIPDSVTSIGDNAFSWCTKLTSITIPDSVTSIGYGSFSGCSELTSVTFKNTNGWKDSNGNPVSVADPEAAATLLKEGDRLTKSN